MRVRMRMDLTRFYELTYRLSHSYKDLFFVFHNSDKIQFSEVRQAYHMIVRACDKIVSVHNNVCLFLIVFCFFLLSVYAYIHECGVYGHPAVLCDELSLNVYKFKYNERLINKCVCGHILCFPVNVNRL